MTRNVNPVIHQQSWEQDEASLSEPQNRAMWRHSGKSTTKWCHERPRDLSVARPGVNVGGIF